MKTESVGIARYIWVLWLLGLHNLHLAALDFIITNPLLYHYHYQQDVQSAGRGSRGNNHRPPQLISHVETNAAAC